MPLPFNVKICGITAHQHAVDAVAVGADAIGLNFYQPSRRSTTAEQAAVIVNSVRPQQATAGNPPQVVGVFVNHSIDSICQLAESLSLDGIQLHGDETVDFFHELKTKIAAISTSQEPFFIRAIRTQPASQTDQPSSEDYHRVCQEIESWNVAGIDLLLIDAAATGEFGGTGKTIDWTLVPKFQSLSQVPIVLAGGLNPNNVGSAIEISGVQAVDVASGVESAPGVKDAEQVSQFVDHARTALQSLRQQKLRK